MVPKTEIEDCSLNNPLWERDNLHGELSTLSLILSHRGERIVFRISKSGFGY